MAAQVYRPSGKFIRAAYVVVLIVMVAAVWAWRHYIPEESVYIPLIPVLLLLIPLRMQLRQMAIKLTLEDEHLILETGLLSKTTRTINIGKVQDVTVRQSVGQRMLGIGDVTVESAGEGSAMTAQNFDQPRELANRILKVAHQQAGTQPSRSAGV